MNAHNPGAFALRTVAPNSADPIFAAIEAHRCAYILASCFSSAAGNLPDHLQDGSDNPAHVAAEAAWRPAAAAQTAAAINLVDTSPTSMAGVLALLAYVESFNNGGLGTEQGLPNGWHSWPEAWPQELFNDKFKTRKSQNDYEMDFGFWILSNVREALQNIAGAK